MSLTVLSDSDIHEILTSLSKEEVERLQTNLSEALHDYSKGSNDCPACSQNQPKRLLIPNPDSRVTLVMPAVTKTSRGIKTVTLQCNAAKTNSMPSLASLNLNRSTSNDSSTSSISAQSPNVSSPNISSPSRHSSTSTTPSTVISGPSFSTPSGSTSASSAPSISSHTAASPHGSLQLLAPNGVPYAFLSAATLTAFRTALASTTIFNKREKVHSITVFGAGLQARWHIRLALILKGSQIHHIDIINRSFARAKALMHDYYTAPSWAKIREANPKLQFSIVSEGFKDREMHVKEHIRKADAIFLCTPSTEPLFPHEILTHSEGRRKGRYISAIGSYRPHMRELPAEVLQQAVAPLHHHHHFHKHADSQGVIIVDSLESCLKEAGEVMDAGLKPKQLVEIGELMMVKKASMREIEMGVGEGEKGLKDWLIKGNVIYKSVGLGLMDICVGEDIVQLAREMGKGGIIDSF